MIQFSARHCCEYAVAPLCPRDRTPESSENRRTKTLNEVLVAVLSRRQHQHSAKGQEKPPGSLLVTFDNLSCHKHCPAPGI